jgi:hypothetical protein
MNLVLTNVLETLVLASPKKALKFGAIVVDHLKKGRNVTIDFSGVQGVTVGFLYLLFSNIYKECGKNISKLVDVTNVPYKVKASFNYLKENYAEINYKYSCIECNPA